MHWINCRCKFNNVPEILGVTDYIKSFKEWWASLQPAGRITASGAFTHTISDGETWGKTQKGGPNGFNTVLIALSFWLGAVTKAKAEPKECEEMIQDVLWVVDSMLTALKHSKKRVRDEDESGGPSKR